MLTKEQEEYRKERAEARKKRQALGYGFLEHRKKRDKEREERQSLGTCVRSGN